MAKGTKTNKITIWLYENKGLSLAYLAKKNDISVSIFYNFVRGISRNNKIEKILISLGVPEKIINDTFSNEKENV